MSSPADILELDPRASFPPEMDHPTLPVRRVVTTRHRCGAFAVTAFVDNGGGFAHSIGGVRIVDASAAPVTEAIRLARGMAEKNPGAGIPASGQKSVVLWPGAPQGVEERALVLAAHHRAVLAVEAGAIFGPDMGVGEAEQDALASRPDLLHHIAGLSREAGGVSIDRFGYTGRALVSALHAWPGISGCDTAAIQGFGAVGAWAARQLQHDRPDVRLVAISNMLGTGVHERGLPVDRLFEAWSSAPVGGADDAVRRAVEATPGARWTASTDAIWTVPAHLFIPAARTSAVRLDDERCENGTPFDAREWLGASGVRAVLQGANAPLTRAAEAWLEAQGVVMFPDFLVNCGGVWGAWLEWVHRDRILAEPGHVDAVDGIATEILGRVVVANMTAAFASPLTRREAAEALRSENLAKVAALYAELEGHPQRLAEHARRIFRTP